MEHTWYEDAVFYHLYTMSLAQAPRENDYRETSHRLPEIERWIPHIRELGCDAILLSPVLKSRSHGYDVTDYYQIDNRLGTNEDFKALVDAFHAAGIRVVLDSVFNHCGRDFFAFQELQNGNRDYASWFSGVDFSRQSPLGDSFNYDTWSGHYELVKFNLNNDATRQYLLDAARFWIDEFDIDGMRLDSANQLDFAFMRDLRKMTTAMIPDFWLMGEVVAGDYSRWVNPETLHSVTDYIIYKCLFSSHNSNNLYELANCLNQAVPNHGFGLYQFLDNHDQPRIASNVNDPAFLNTLYTLLFTLPGIPSIYYGSEWGIAGAKESGSDAPLRPYIDLSDPPEDPLGLTGHIQKLAAIRGEQSALRYGGYQQRYLAYHKPFVFERSWGNECVIVAVNTQGTYETVPLHDRGRLLDLLSGERFDPGDVTIPPHASRILIPAD